MHYDRCKIKLFFSWFIKKKSCAIQNFLNMISIRIIIYSNLVSQAELSHDKFWLEPSWLEIFNK
jgi:hypothetical protein